MRILFVHNGRERFVLDDLRLLQESHSVTDWRQGGRLFNVARLLRLVRSHDLLFCWFASWHSFLPVLLAHRLGKPSIVVVGGYDTANVPEAGYGSQRAGLSHFMPRFISRTVISNATKLITNSEAAKREVVANAGAQPSKIVVIYHGVEALPMGKVDGREPMALTVGNVWRENLLRKGLLPFVQAAAYLPDVRFVLAGRWCDDSIEELKRIAGPNVEFTGFVSDQELHSLYTQASVYVQASLHEGFGLSVAEAMSAGCIPVVARVGALPEVVGDCGVYSQSNAPADIACAIKNGLAAPAMLRFQARQRVLNCFQLGQRGQVLERIIHSTADRL